MNHGSATFVSPEGSAGRWRVRWVDTTGSTNADLAEQARGGEPAGLVLVADHQTAGRGRLGRAWSAPPEASLLVSVLLRPPPHAPVHGTVWAVGLAARDACVAVTGVEPVLKWPNDLLLGERKLAGILSEAILDQGRVVAVVVGMGLNVNWPDPADLPAELAGVVAALNHAAGRPVDRRVLLDAYLEALHGYVALLEQAPAALGDAYRRALGTLGRSVRADLPGSSVTGRAVDVDAEGALVVEAADGTRHVIRVGDVVHLRPA